MIEGGEVAATFCATLVDEWARAGVEHAVVSPGSRSTPLALALLTDPRIHVDVVIDERSAGFTALGMALSTGRPAVLVCTSGTAAAGFHPAVIEAHESGVPLIVCTADRPPELHHVGAPQTTEQEGLYGGTTRWAASPGVPDLATARSWRSFASRAFLEATGRPPGPVHLNLAFRDPLVGAPGPLPAARPGDRPWRERADAAPASVDRDALDHLVKRLAGRRVVAVIGGGLPPGTAASLHALAEAANWPVLADPRSGAYDLRPSTVPQWDAVLRQLDFVARHQPEVVIRLGEPPASKVLAEWMAHSDTDQIVFPATARTADPAHTADVVVDGHPVAVLDALRGPLSSRRAEPGWRRAWVTAGLLAASAVSQALARFVEPVEPMVARGVMYGMPDGADLVVSSSMPIRDLEWFAAPRAGVRVLANRGVNGIDGVVSTALGVALTGRRTVALVGDLAFLHDSNALLNLQAREVDLVIVVIDNRGGGIFSFLPQHEALNEAHFEQLFGTPHDVDLVSLAKVHGLRARVVEEGASVSRSVANALDTGGAHVLVTRTDRTSNVEVHHTLHQAVDEAFATSTDS